VEVLEAHLSTFASRTRFRRRRRDALLTLLWRLACLVCLGLSMALSPQAPGVSTAASPLEIGLTYSHSEATFLDLPWQSTFDAALEVSPALVRLGAYWNEIEAERGVYDFTTLDWLLDRATERNQRVLLTVGMKAPRWPEYYIPYWLAKSLVARDGAQVSDDPQLRAATLAFVRATVEHVRDRTVIDAWQVENEPLDSSGPHSWHIGSDFLNEEIALVRSLDTRERPIVVTAFIETQPLMMLPLPHGQTMARAREALATADVLGLDVYPTRIFHIFGREFTVTWPARIWSGILTDLREMASSQGKDAWIVEAQAEPWFSAGKLPPPVWPGAGVRPASAASVLAPFEAAGFTTVLLWGLEHWESRRALHKDTSWWAAVTDIFSASAHARERTTSV